MIGKQEYRIDRSGQERKQSALSVRVLRIEKHRVQCQGRMEEKYRI